MSAAIDMRMKRIMQEKKALKQAEKNSKK